MCLRLYADVQHFSNCSLLFTNKSYLVTNCILYRLQNFLKCEFLVNLGPKIFSDAKRYCILTISFNKRL